MRKIHKQTVEGQSIPIDEMADWLSSLGLSVTKQKGGYRIDNTLSHKVCGILGERDSWYAKPDEWILAIDHVGCYDKPQKCAIRTFENESIAAEYKQNLLEAIQFLGTDAGYLASNGFEVLWPLSS